MNGKLVAMINDRITELREYPVPHAEKGGVVMRTIRANICGSDVKIWEGKHFQRNHVLGHEMVGRILELGEGVTTDYAGNPVETGDRIVPCYFITCMHCRSCVNGLYNYCENANIYGAQKAELYPHFTGGFATHYYIAPNQHFYKVPDCISDETAAGINCGITQMVYSLERAGLRAGMNVVLQGAGGLGLYGCAISKEAGANPIIIDSVSQRLEMAKRFGANHVIDMKEFDTIDKRKAEIDRITNGEGADLVVELAGIPAAFDESIRLVAPGGTVAEVGNILSRDVDCTSIVPGLIMRKSITIIGCGRYDPRFIYKTIKFLEKFSKKYPFDELTDRCYPLSEIQTAFAKAASKEVTRAVIDTSM